MKKVKIIHEYKPRGQQLTYNILKARAKIYIDEISKGISRLLGFHE